MIDEVAQRSRRLFETGLCCTEGVVLSIAESKGIKSDLIPKIASGFCGGMARTSRTCGAVSGGIMAIGLFFGRSSPDDTLATAYSIIQEFLTAFEERYGSTNCKKLTGCDLGTEEGRKYFSDHKLSVNCHEYTEEATRIALSLIEKNL